MSDLKLIIIRGLPGSGRGVLANELIAEDESLTLIEPEHWFELAETKKMIANKSITKDVGDNSFYTICKAASDRWCRCQATNTLLSGKSVVITGIYHLLVDMKALIIVAEQQGATIEVMTALSDGDNKGRYPSELVDQYDTNWEHLRSLNDILESKK